MPLLFCFLTPRREQTARKALATTAASLYLQVATTALNPRATCRLATRRGCRCTAGTRPCGSSTWPTYSPTHGAPNPNTTSTTSTS